MINPTPSNLIIAFIGSNAFMLTLCIPVSQALPMQLKPHQMPGINDPNNIFLAQLKSQSEDNDLLPEDRLPLVFPDLPPEPNPLLNNETIEGIDLNQNGIRDDIERWIFRRFSDSNDLDKRNSLLQYAKAFQLRLINFADKHKSIDYTYKIFGSGHCVLSFFDIQEGLKLASLINSMTLNTELRIKADFQNDVNFSGQTYTLPKTAEYRSYCHF